MRERLDDRIHRLRRVEHRRAAVLQGNAAAASLGGAVAAAGGVAHPGGHLRRDTKAIGRRRSRRRERIAALRGERLGQLPGIRAQGTKLVMLAGIVVERSEEHTSELQSLMRISYAVFCLKKTKQKTKTRHPRHHLPHK